MFNILENIPKEILLEANKIFIFDDCNKAADLIRNKKVNISFLKGSLDSYFVISGLFFETQTYKSKISYNVEKTPALESKCNCDKWNEKTHCKHIAGLYIYFLCFQDTNKKETKDCLSTQIQFTHHQFSHGVFPRIMGTIIKGHNDLYNALPNAPIRSCQMLLLNKKIINFPETKAFPALTKIIVSLINSKDIEEYKNYNQENKELFFPILALKYPDGAIEKNISIFENNIIFDWNTGEAYEVTPLVQNCITNLKLAGQLNSLRNLTEIFSPLTFEEIAEIKLPNNNILEKSDCDKPKLILKIIDSDKKGFIDLNFTFNDPETNIPIYFPAYFGLMLMDNGILSYFRTKNNAINFIGQFSDTSVESLETLQFFDFNSNYKWKIDELINNLKYNSKFLLPNLDFNKFYQFDSLGFKSFLSNFLKYFSKNALRFSQNNDDLSFVITVPKNLFYAGIGSFLKSIKHFTIETYFQNKQVSNWKSEIKISRDKSNIDWFSLSLDISDFDLQVIQKSMIGNNYLITKDNNLILLDEKENDLLTFLKKHVGKKGNLVGKSEKQNSFHILLKRSRIFEIFELKKYGIIDLLTKEEEDLCQSLLTLKELPNYDLPNMNNVSPRPYQLLGFHWLRFLYENKLGACLADDMGLGKTLQTIMFLQSIIDKVENILIVCPVSIILNWESEIKKFSSLGVNLFYGKERTLDNEAKINITSYGILKRELEQNLKDKKFDIVIFDEVQHIKNIKSQGASAARKLNNNFTICLTGTPVENDIVEFYNILDLSIPGVLGDLGSIKNLTSTEGFTSSIKKSVKPFILRRTKGQVLTELPDKIENKVMLSFSDEEQAFYNSQMLSVHSSIKDQTTKLKFGEVLKQLLRMRQLCLWQQQNNLLSTKLDFLEENLEQIVNEGHKVLIFSQFTTYLNLIQERIGKNNWKYSRIDGTYTHKKREVEIKNFQEGENQIFLVSLKAGGVGLNLTAANYVYIMDPWWNPAVENQAIDRAHRIGQKNCVNVYRLIIKDSIEEKVLILQERKRQLFNDLLGSEDDAYFNGKLTMNDFEFLLS